MSLLLLLKPVFTAGGVHNVDLTPGTETDLARRLSVFMAARETDVAVTLVFTQTAAPCVLTTTGISLGVETLTGAALCAGGQSLVLTPADPQPL